jgi:hypothetical protein
MKAPAGVIGSRLLDHGAFDVDNFCLLSRQDPTGMCDLTGIVEFDHKSRLVRVNEAKAGKRLDHSDFSAISMRRRS